MQPVAISPQYIVVAEALKSRMQSLAHNSLLPSEEQLAKSFGVSRVTIRRALDLLERGGLVDRQRGRGTIVNPPKVTRTIWPPLMIEHDFIQQGISMDTEVLSVERDAVVPERIKRWLQLSATERVAKILMVRRVEDRVICCDCRYVSDAICARVDLKRIGQTPISVLIAQCADRPITNRQWELEFVPCSEEQGKILGVTAGTLVVASTGTHFLDNVTALWITEIFYRVDRVKFAFSSLEQAEATPTKTDERRC